MADQRTNTEMKHNLWAPWRMEYIETLSDKDDGCFLCHHRDDHDDRGNLVIWRGSRCMALMNRFPYTGGHTLICPKAHEASLSDLDGSTMLEMMEMARDMQKLLDHAVGADGYNMGVNMGRCAGAGLPGHLHLHVVPRWSGDTNFVTVLGEVRVIPEALEKLYDRMVRLSGELQLPELTP